MVKTILPAVLLFAAMPVSGKGVKSNIVKYKPVEMDYGVFSCLVPDKWEMQKADKKKMKKGVYGIELYGPRENDAPVMAYITFYSKKNPYFKDYRDFINRNSTDLFGEKEGGGDKYGKVKKIKLNGKTAYKFDNEIKEYLEPEGKSEDFVVFREKYYVIPSSKGFHVIHFTVPKNKYYKYYRIFNKVALSFRGI